MKKILFAVGLAVAVAACSTDDGDAMMENPNYDDSKEMLASVSFEGVWSIDDEPLGQTYVLTLSEKNGLPCLMLNTFPYKAVANKLLPESLQLATVMPSVQPPSLYLQQVGFSELNSYYQQDATNSSPSVPISFNALTVDGTETMVTLELLPSVFTCVVNQEAADCILAVKRIEVMPVDGQPRQWMLNPERKLTFTSTKRI